jgi:hypothetical protein
LELTTSLFLKQPRENAGSRTSNRYDYQKDWAICKLTELHASGGDFLLSFEFHDDILVFDSSTAPSEINCFQIKSKEKKGWTPKELYTGKKGKRGDSYSFLAKLYLHLKDHQANVAGLSFVTNSFVKSKLKDDSECSAVESFMLGDLSEDVLKKLCDQMKMDLKTQDLDDFCKVTKIHQHQLDINHHSEITQGRLAKFIEVALPNVRYQIGPIYKAIFDEVKTKTNVEHQVLNFDDLKRLKSISRTDFDRYLKAISDQEDFRELAKSIENRLNAEQASFSFVAEFGRYAKQYEVDRMDHTNMILQSTVSQIAGEIKVHSSISPQITQQMQEIFDKLPEGTNVFPGSYLRTIILFELYGKG